MAWPSEIVFVRHAESEGNVRSVAERAAFPVATHAYKLTERGREQALITGGWLKQAYPDGFDVGYTSYYTRAKETFALMAQGVRAYEDDRLAEAQRGIWHTMTHDEVERYYPGEVERKKREGLYHYRPLGGENWPDVKLRIHSFMGTLARDYAHQRVLIVCHGHWLMMFQQLVHHFSIEEALARYDGKLFDNASVTTYVPDASTERLRVGVQNFIPWEGAL